MIKLAMLAGSVAAGVMGVTSITLWACDTVDGRKPSVGWLIAGAALMMPAAVVDAVYWCAID